MGIITNYIGINLLKGISIVAILLLGVDLFFYFINELRFIGTGNYDLLAACEFVLLTIPRKLYIMSPWAALIGSLLILGSMAKNGELVVMRTIGISTNKIALFGSYYVLFFTVIVFIFGELLAPNVELFAQKRKTLALSKGKAIYTSYGTWVRSGNNFIHVAKVKNHNTIQNVTIYELDQDLKLKRSTLAKSAQLVDLTSGIWELKDIVITDFSKLYNLQGVNNTDLNNTDLNNAIQLIKLPNKLEQNLLDLNILKTANIKHLERLSIKNLIAIIKDRLANGLAVLDYQVAFWKKISQPFSILIMSYLSVPFVLGPLRSSSRGLRLLVGVILGAIFHLMNALFCPLVTVINFPPSIAVILPPMVFLSLAVYLSIKI